MMTEKKSVVSPPKSPASRGAWVLFLTAAVDFAAVSSRVCRLGLYRLRLRLCLRLGLSARHSRAALATLLSLALSLNVLPQSLSSRAMADFKPLASPATVANWSAFCNDVNQVSQIITLFDNSVTLSAAAGGGGPVTGTMAMLASKGQVFYQICAIVIAAASAKNVQGVLNAVTIANSLTGHLLDSQIDHFQDSLSMYDFLANLKNSHQSGKSKVLNVQNWQRVMDYAFRTFPLDSIDARRTGLQIANAADKAQAIEEATDAIYGCRKPVTALKPGDIQIPDGPTSQSKIERWSREMTEAGQNRELAAQQVAKITGVLRRMITQVAHDADEARSALELLDVFTRKAFWVSVNFAAPATPVIEKGTTAVVVNPVAKYQAPNAGPTVTAVPSRPASMIVEDNTNTFYKQDGMTIVPDFSCLNQPTKQMELWIGSHADWLQDRYIKGEWIAQSVNLCPSSNIQDSLYATPIASFHPTSRINKLADGIRATSAGVSTNCKLRRMQQVLRELRRLDGLGTEPTIPGMPSALDQPCTPTPDRALTEDPTSPKVSAGMLEELITYQGFVDYYNDKFNDYIDIQYNQALTNNMATRALAPLSLSMVSFMSGSQDGFGTRDTWNPADVNRMDPRQVAFLNTWRQVDLCAMPYYLLQKYPGIAPRVIQKGRPIEAEGYGDLVKKCKADLSKTDSNKNVFRDMWMNGLASELLVLNQAKATIFQTDLKIGAYKKSARRKPATCQETPNAKDIMAAQSRVALIGVEIQNDILELQAAIHADNLRREADVERRSRETETQYLSTVKMWRDNDLRDSLMYPTPEENPGFNYGKIGPSLPALRQQEKAIGPMLFPSMGSGN